MRFTQIDRIQELNEGDSIRAIKCLALSEEYLKDHFPRFPVMPGVIMMEAMFQASMWLFRATTEFKHSMVVLREARNVRFRDLVEPGDRLVIDSKLKKMEDSTADFQVTGHVNDQPAVSGRIKVAGYRLYDENTDSATVDEYMIGEFQRKFSLLVGRNFKLKPETNLALGKYANT